MSDQLHDDQRMKHLCNALFPPIVVAYGDLAVILRVRTRGCRLRSHKLYSNLPHSETRHFWIIFCDHLIYVHAIEVVLSFAQHHLEWIGLYFCASEAKCSSHSDNHRDEGPSEELLTLSDHTSSSSLGYLLGIAHSCQGCRNTLLLSKRIALSRGVDVMSPSRRLGGCS